MSILEQVTGMQQQGFSEQQIVERLEEDGFSPREVHDALNRAQIKSAVSKDTPGVGVDLEMDDNMQPSIMAPSPESGSQGQKQHKGYYDDDLDVPKPMGQARSAIYPKTQEINGNSFQESFDQQSQENQEEAYSPMPPYSSQYPQTESQGYGEYSPYSQGSYTDTDTMIEVSEQVFAEKIKHHAKKIEEASEFKTLAGAKLENFEDRLKRIENQIDKLQAAILEEVGKYGRGLDSVKREMEMIESSFGKLASGLHSSGHRHTTTASKPAKKKSTVTVHKSTKHSKRK